MGKLSFVVASAFLTTAFSLSDDVGVSAAAVIQRKLAARSIHSAPELQHSNKYGVDDTRALLATSKKGKKGKVEKKKKSSLALNITNWLMVTVSGTLQGPKIYKWSKLGTEGKEIEASELSTWLSYMSTIFATVYANKSGFPFKEWGENALVAVQSLVLLSIFTGFNSKNVADFKLWPRITGLVLSVLAGTGLLLTPSKLLSETLSGYPLKSLSVISTLCSFGSKISKIIKYIQLQLEAPGKLVAQDLYAPIMVSGGNTIRLITTLKGSGDILTLVQHGLGLTLNITILIQKIVDCALTKGDVC